MAGNIGFRDHWKRSDVRCRENLTAAKKLMANFDGDGVLNETSAQHRKRLASEQRAHTVEVDGQKRSAQDDAELAAIQASTARFLGNT